MPEEETEEDDDDLLDKVIAKCVKSRFLLKAAVELADDDIEIDDAEDDELKDAYDQLLAGVEVPLLRRINKIDFELGYDKGDDKDKMDFINNLPSKDRKGLLDAFKKDISAKELPEEDRMKLQAFVKEWEASFSANDKQKNYSFLYSELDYGNEPVV